jgi:hypothetical protein
VIETFLFEILSLQILMLCFLTGMFRRVWNEVEHQKYEVYRIAGSVV